MSKKKNTLKDLDEFLKQQAANLVAPEKLSERLESAPTETPIPTAKADSLSDQLRNILNTDGMDAFCQTILSSLPSGSTPTEEEILLINTALYIKGGKLWKQTVRDYWSKR